MLSKRIIPCLDVKNNNVVKGVRFKNHTIVGDILDLTQRYQDEGADELVLYDITASSDNKKLEKKWIENIAKILEIPFCVAGGIRTIEDTKKILYSGADKISINSPALENPALITDIANIFGTQCVVVGVDSLYINKDYYVYQYTGNETKTISTQKKTINWVKEAQERGAGEIVLNCMNNDGVRDGYDIQHLQNIRKVLKIPLIASGGAGKMEDFKDVFIKSDVDGALAASVFHKKVFSINALKHYLQQHDIIIRN